MKSHPPTFPISTTFFDPKAGKVIISPDGEGPGYWVGANSVTYVAEEDAFYLYYRRRGPRPERGNRCYILKGTKHHSQEDWVWTRIWEGRKEDVDENCPSFEKSALVHFPSEGVWRLYISYVDPVDQRWRIDYTQATHPSLFSISASSRVEVLTAASTSTEGVKDPEILPLPNGHWRMYFTFVPPPSTSGGSDEEARKLMHGTADVLNTGTSKALTGYADSTDSTGTKFIWTSIASNSSLQPPSAKEAWNFYCTRITTVWDSTLLDGSTKIPVKAALYDGTYSVEGNYEERTALAVSRDGGLTFEDLSPKGPLLVSEFNGGSLRYVVTLLVKNQRYWFYEVTNSNGSHEVRMVVLREQ